MQYENSMNTEVQEILLQKILMRERIQITSGRHRRTSFSLLIIYGFTAVLAVSFFAYLNGLTWELIGLAGLLGFSFFPLYSMCKKIADVTAKGDALLVNQFSHPCKVTSIKSVSKVKTLHLFSFSVTSLTFFLDGDKRKVLLINKNSQKQNKPDSIIRFIMKAA